jgi:hypothetical protein
LRENWGFPFGALTYMATIHSALSAGVLEEYRLPGHDSRTPRRPLYVACALYDELDKTDALFVKNWSSRNGGRTRSEHLHQMFSDFRCHVRPLTGDMNRVQPTRKGVWKMHCPGLRVYGWVPEPHSFVAVTFALIEDAHGPNSLTNDKVKTVLKYANDNALDKTIMFGDRIALFP